MAKTMTKSPTTDGQIERAVEASNGVIIRHARPDRNLSPKAVLDATGRSQYTPNPNLVNAMPKGVGDEVEVHFFLLPRDMSHSDIEQECAHRGLVSADPYSQAKVNEDDPSFADNYPNATHFQDADGNWVVVTFPLWNGPAREVGVHHFKNALEAGWWCAGIPKTDITLQKMALAQ